MICCSRGRKAYFRECIRMQCYEEYYREIRSADGTIVRIETHVPSDFNFAYDVIDRYAEHTPDKQAMVHKSLEGTITRFTFGDLKLLSDKAAVAFERLGIGKGVPVMLLLKRRYEFWVSVLALHKLGAVAVPTSHMVSAEDIEQRIQTAGVKAIICVNTDHICEKAAEAIGKRSITAIAVGSEYPGFLSWNNLMDAAKNECP